MRHILHLTTYAAVGKRSNKTSNYYIMETSSNIAMLCTEIITEYTLLPLNKKKINKLLLFEAVLLN